MLGCKISFNKFKKNGITQNIFSDYKGMKPAINNEVKWENSLSMWKLNND
jgi:hypothetical protein